MFAKKLLSFIGLLFVGIQFTSATTCVLDGSVTKSSCTVNSCTETTDDGYYAVFKDDKGDYTNLDVDTNSTNDLLIIEVSGSNVCTVPNDIEVGYFKTKAELYVSKSYNDQYAKVTPTGTCADNIAGTLDENNKLCLGVDSHSTAVEQDFTNDGKVYLTGDSANVFGSTGNALVTSTTNSIVVKDYTGEYCVDEDSKVVTERADNYCDSSNDCDKYYTCSKGATCTDTTGIFDKRSSCGDPTKSTDADAGCNGYYLRTDLYYCASTVCTKKDKLIGVFVDAEDSNKMIKCIATETVDVDGYAKNSCSSVENAIGDSCGEIGDIIYDSVYKICKTKGDKTDAITISGTEKQILLSANVDNGTFTKTAVGASTYVIVNFDGINAILRQEAGYQIYDASSEILVVSETTGVLYTCTLDENGIVSCVNDQTVRGYLANGNKDGTVATNFPFIEANGGSTATLLALATAQSKTQCSSPGDLVYANTVYNVCLSSGSTDYIPIAAPNTIAETAATASQYFMDASETSIFVGDADANGYFVVVDFDLSSVVLNKDELKYRYTVQNGKQTVVKGDSRSTNVCSGNKDEYVHRKNNGDKAVYYIKKSA